MFHDLRRAILAAGGVAICACSETSTPSTPVSMPAPQEVAAVVASPWYTAEQVRSLDRLARALGEGLAEPAARAALHASLRASPLSEHKVVLLDFLGTAQGRVLLAAAAGRSDQTAEELRSLATTLPPVDFYVPHISHRQRWQIQDRIAVAVLVDEFSPLFGYVAGRDSLFIDRLSTTPNPVAVLLLGPNEYKHARPGAGSSLGDHRFIEEDPREATPPARMQCLEECGGGGGGGGGPPPPTDSLWGDTLVTVNICDNGFCWEGNEFEISAIYPTGTGYTRRCEGIGSTAVVRLRFVCNGFLNKISETAPTEFPYVDVRVIETDGWPNPDDWFYAYKDPPPLSAVNASLRVVDNGLRRKAWVLYKVNYGQGCTPNCTEWVELMLKW